MVMASNGAGFGDRGPGAARAWRETAGEQGDRTVVAEAGVTILGLLNLASERASITPV